MRSFRNIADRVWVGSGFASRYGCLLLMILYFVLVLVMVIRSGRLTFNLKILASTALITAALIAWMLRPRQRFFHCDETGVVRANSHCRSADAHSSPVK